jgi:hypothetical protein
LLFIPWKQSIILTMRKVQFILYSETFLYCFQWKRLIFCCDRNNFVSFHGNVLFSFLWELLFFVLWEQLTLVAMKMCYFRIDGNDLFTFLWNKIFCLLWNRYNSVSIQKRFYFYSMVTTFSRFYGNDNFSFSHIGTNNSCF